MPRTFWQVAWTAAVGLVLLTYGPAEAAESDQHIDRALSRYHHSSWQVRDGLPQNTVASISQTVDGYLWLATESGLVRFDGNRFTVFHRGNVPQLQNNDIGPLLTAKDGSLWVGTAGGGLLRMRHGGREVFTIDDGLAGNIVLALYEDTEGSLWIGTTNGVSRLSGGRLSHYGLGDGLTSDFVTTIRGTNDGSIWFGSHEGLSRFKEGRFTHFRAPDLPSNDVRELWPSRDGGLWVGTTRGLVRLGAGTFTPASSPLMAGHFIVSLLEDRSGALWVGTRGAGVARLSGARVSRFDVEDGLTDRDVVSLFEDRDGAMWIGTNAGGLNRLNRSLAVVYGRPEGLSDDIALPVVADRRGAIWVGTSAGGLNQFATGRWTAYTTRDGLSHNRVLALHPARDGSLWIGTLTGLDRLQNGKVVQHADRLGIAGYPVLALLESSDGALWIGTPTGLLCVRNGKVERYGAGDGLSSDYVTVLYEDRQKRLWVGTQGGGISRRRGRGFEAFDVPPDVGVDMVWSIHEDPSGSLWFGTNGGGLIRVTRGRVRAYTTRDGLFTDTIFRILDDERGHLWMSSNQGVFRVAVADLDALDAGRLTRVGSVSYSEHDGMRSREANGGVQPAGWKTDDGRLWFPTLKGVAVFDPRHAGAGASVSAVIEDVFVDRSPFDLRAAAVVSPGAKEIEFHYTAPNLLAAHRVQFRYRLEGFDETWVEAGAQRTARYTNIPPGEYRFRVIASNGDGGWDDSESSLSFTRSPHWYQTTAFYAMCVLAPALLGAAFHRARISGLKVREKELTALADARQWTVEQNAGLLAEVERQRQHFDDVLANVPGIVWEAWGAPDAKTQRCGFVSAHAEAMVGYPLREWLETPNFWLTIVHPDDRDRVAAEAAAMYAQPCGGTLEFRWVAKGGHTVSVEAHCSVISNENGVAGMRGVTMDVSARQRLEEQLRQAQRMEAMGRLAGGVAHDFNNLLTAIIGYSDMIDPTRIEDPSAVDAVTEIRAAADRAAALTRQLLAFSRRQLLQTTVLDLAEIVTQTSGLLRRVIGEHIELITRTRPGRGFVRADRGQLEQVIMNLAVNARDAMPQGGTLTITTAEVRVEHKDVFGAETLLPGRYITLAVSDTGHGMDPDTRQRIFEPFFTTKEMGKGTGLGLATVHGIVKQTGGAIRVCSAPGRGTTFTIYLAAVEPVSPMLPAPADEDLPDGTETILLAEDDSAVRTLTRRMLTRRGYRVVEAADGVEALTLAERHGDAIALLLTDLVMPTMGGPDLAVRFRAGRANVPVLLMSGYTDEATAGDLAIPGDTLILQKPFTPATLAKKIREALDGVRPASQAPLPL